MLLLSISFVLVFLSSISIGTPILEGEDVGKVQIVGRKVTVTGQRKFPYMVRIVIQTNGGHAYCGGVLIGKGAVLTAAHCVSTTISPRIVVSAGFVDTNYELESIAQNRVVKDWLIHGAYRKTCKVGASRCCFLVNDIAILWTMREFTLGPKVKIAQLNNDLHKPVGQTGWILGWGSDGEVMPSMLQKGLVKVTSEETCRKFDPVLYITQSVVCLSPVAGNTQAESGDSGGPFVIEGVVYGISSHTMLCSGTMDVYTYVAKYQNWISNNLNAGPPKERPSSKPTKKRRNN